MEMFQSKSDKNKAHSTLSAYLNTINDDKFWEETNEIISKRVWRKLSKSNDKFNKIFNIHWEDIFKENQKNMNPKVNKYMKEKHY